MEGVVCAGKGGSTRSFAALTEDDGVDVEGLYRLSDLSKLPAPDVGRRVWGVQELIRLADHLCAHTEQHHRSGKRAQERVAVVVRSNDDAAARPSS